MTQQHDKILMIACMALFCLTVSSLTHIANATEEAGASPAVEAPVKGAKRALAASLVSSGSSSVLNMATDLSQKSEAERGGSLRKALSSQVADKAMDKAMSTLMTKYPALAATAPLIAHLKPAVSEKVGRFVDRIGSKKADKQEPAKEEADGESLEDERHDEKSKDEKEPEENAWNKFKKAVKVGDDDQSDQNKEDEAEGERENEEAKKSNEKHPKAE